MLNKIVVRHVIQRTWNTNSGLIVIDVKENVYIFKFATLDDMKRVLDGDYGLQWVPSNLKEMVYGGYT